MEGRNKEKKKEGKKEGVGGRKREEGRKGGEKGGREGQEERGRKTYIHKPSSGGGEGGVENNQVTSGYLIPKGECTLFHIEGAF